MAVEKGGAVHTLPRVPIDFTPYGAVLIDLDGTVYQEDHALPGAVDLLRRFQETGQRFALLTNSTTSPRRVVARLQRMGVDIDEGHVYTAAVAACDYVMERYGHGGGRRPRVFNLATEGVQELLEGKVEWVHTGGEPCDVVMVGVPVGLYATEERQRIALSLLRRKSDLIGVCADRVYPSPRGIEFGAGALTMMLAYAAQVEPLFTGKPQEVFFRKLCERLGVDPRWCLLIGDNLESDIWGARRVGMRTILTLTGVTRRRDLAAAGDGMAPDLVVEDLTELA